MKKKNNYKRYERNSIFSSLQEFDPGFAKEHDYIEITEWYNGEGFDVVINDKQFQLTYGQFEALQALVLYKG